MYIYIYITYIITYYQSFGLCLKNASRRITNIGKNTFSSKLNGVELWPFEV